MWNTRAVLAIAMLVLLAACFEGDPEFSEAEQLPAEQREAMQNGDDADAEPADIAATATFVSVDNDFTDQPTEVPAGVIEFELVNEGNATHNVTLDDLGDQVVVEAGGQSTETATIELEPGEYAFHCDIPGHEQAMQGTFTVTE